jgi:hypothetical protein
MQTMTQRVISRIQRANRSSRLVRISDSENVRYDAIQRLRRSRHDGVAQNAQRIGNWSNAHVYRTWLMSATHAEIAEFAAEQRLIGGAA